MRKIAKNKGRVPKTTQKNLAQNPFLQGNLFCSPQRKMRNKKHQEVLGACFFVFGVPKLCKIGNPCVEKPSLQQ